MMIAKLKEVLLSDRVEGLLICFGVTCAFLYGAIDMVPAKELLFDIEDTAKFLFESTVLFFSTIMVSALLGLMGWYGWAKLFEKSKRTTRK